EEHRRTLGFRFQPHEIAAHSCVSRIIGCGLAGEPLIICGDRFCLGIVVLKQRQQCHGAAAGSGQFREAIEEFATINVTVGETVVELDDALIHLPPQWWAASMRRWKPPRYSFVSISRDERQLSLPAFLYRTFW